MDLQMPIMSGYEATAIIREHDAQVPIIALTAAAMIEDRDKVLSSGMNDHLGKPIDTAELYASIAKWCGIDLPKSPARQRKEAQHKVLDVEFASEMVSGNSELLSKLFSRFLAQLEGEFSDIAERIERDDPFAPSMVHALKGVSGNLGAMELSLICTRIDALYKAGEKPGGEEIARLASSVRELQEVLELIPRTISAEVHGEWSREQLRNEFERVIKELEGGNMVQPDQQKNLYEGLRSAVDPLELEQWWDAMDEFDYDRALKIMRGWEIG